MYCLATRYATWWPGLWERVERSKRRSGTVGTHAPRAAAGAAGTVLVIQFGLRSSSGDALRDSLLSDTLLVGSPIARAGEPFARDERLHEHRLIALGLVPVRGKPARRCAEDLRREVGHPKLGQDQTADSRWVSMFRSPNTSVAVLTSAAVPQSPAGTRGRAVPTSGSARGR